MNLNNQTAPDLGVSIRLPAEFEPRQTVYLGRPKRAKSWPNCLKQAQAQHTYFVQRLQEVVDVVFMEDLKVPTSDVWLRDSGPIFVEVTDLEKQTKQIQMHGFGFNHWGAQYPGWELDNQVPNQMAHVLNRPLIDHALVMEGGGIDSNEQGTLLVTTPCLVDDNRNPQMSQDQIDQVLKTILGLNQVVWLPQGLNGDETGGHVDNFARFVLPDTVLCVSAPAGHADHESMKINHGILSEAGFHVAHLPLPQEQVRYTYPSHAAMSDGLTGEQVLTASYANFLLVNGVCFLPTFDQPASDQRAAAIVREVSGLDVVQIPSRYLLVGGGNVHCLTKDEPTV